VCETQILVVDDDDDMRMLVRALIKAANEGLTVGGEGVDGEEAIRMCRELAPNVVVLDNRMPIMTGMEAVRRIRAEFGGAIVIILFTAFVNDAVVAEAREAGVSRVLPKEDLRLLPDVIRSLRPAC
jgi:CheY-like chemotaxis protein